jgi:hypothetical protein
MTYIKVNVRCEVYGKGEATLVDIGRVPMKLCTLTSRIEIKENNLQATQQSLAIRWGCVHTKKITIGRLRPYQKIRVRGTAITLKA